MDKFFCKALPKNKKKGVSSRSTPTTKITADTKKVNLLDPFRKSHAVRDKYQSYLDFGQKSFGKSIVCPKCKMFFVAGVEDDEKNHLKFCRSQQNLNIDTLCIRSLRHDWERQDANCSNQVKVVWEDMELKHCVVKVSMDSDAFRNTSRQSAARWRDIVEKVLSEMGSPLTAIDDKGCNLYLYVDTKEDIVKGIVITEKVHSSDLRLFCPKSSCLISAADEPLNEIENICSTKRTRNTLPESSEKRQKLYDISNSKKHEMSNDKSKSLNDRVPGNLSIFNDDYLLLTPEDLLQPNCSHMLREVPLSAAHAIGIKQMWVTNKNRRQGIAHRILESIRTTALNDPTCPQFIPSHERFKICFSQPTSDGLRCAMKYVAPTKALWIYSQSSVNCRPS